MRQKLTFTAPAIGVLLALSLVGCSTGADSESDGAASSSQSTAEGCEAAASKLGGLSEKSTELKQASDDYAKALAAGGDTTSQQQAAADAIEEITVLYSDAAKSVENADVKAALEGMAQAMTKESEATTEADLAAAKKEVGSSSDAFVELCGTE